MKILDIALAILAAIIIIGGLVLTFYGTIVPDWLILIVTNIVTAIIAKGKGSVLGAFKR